MRVQIGLGTGALCVILVALVSAGAAWFGTAEASRAAGARVTQIASELSHRLDTSMGQRYSEVGILSQLAPLQPYWTANPAVLRGTLEQLQSSYPNYAWIGFAGTDGIVRAATGGLLEGQSVSQRPWFSHGLSGPTVSDLHEALLLNKLLGASSEPRRFVDIAFPVKDRDGQVIGVLGAHLYSTWVNELRDRFSELLNSSGASLREKTEVRVLSADGREIVGPEPGTQVLSGAALDQVAQDGAALRTAMDNDVHYLEGFAQTRGERGFPGFGWIVSARQPTATAWATVRAMMLAILATGAIAAAVGVVLSYALAARIASPIRHLCEEAERIGRSPTGAKLKRAGGCEEVATLSHSLRSLIRRLGTAERQLVDAAERASMASADIEKQMETLRRLAASDPMTGLLNRRGFLEAVHRDHVAPPAQRLSGVLIIDIDHFKRVNDRYGHAVGDAVIRSVAETVRATARQRDITARFGGEEFVILTQDASPAALMALAERIRISVQHSRSIDGKQISVSVSIGGAIAGAVDDDVQDTIDRADIALYAAKEAGRNCVRINSDTGLLTLMAA